MGKTKIEWCDYTINPVKGLCPMACPYCYARRMYKRFHWDETIRFDVHGYQDAPDWNMESLKRSSRIFVGSTMELFGEWVEPRWLGVLFQVVRRYPQHTFIFLTKQPQNLIKWSPFPDNCWVGVSATDYAMTVYGAHALKNISAKVKFISFEPLLKFLPWPTLDGVLKSSGINWVIIGQQTPVKAITMPNKAWIDEIINAADKASVPVFLKNNLQCIFDINCKVNLRQEFPII